MKGICKRVGTLLLAIALLLSLCACAQGRRQEESNDQKGSAEAVTLPPGTDREAPETQPAQDTLSPEAETALGWLRDRIDFPTTMFGAAYTAPDSAALKADIQALIGQLEKFREQL